MKLRNLFLASLTLMSLAACSNDDDPIKDGPEKTATAYMQLSVTGVPTYTTKTDGGTTEDASTKESKVTNLTVYLCDPNDYSIKQTIPVTAFKGGAENPGGPISYETEKFQITTPVSADPSAPTKFAVFVLANDKGGMFTPATNITETTIESITEDNIKNNFANENYFIMFNYCNGKDLVPKYTVDISTACTWDNPAQCKGINLDRLAVKIRSKQKGSPDFTLDNSKNKFDIKKADGSFHTVLADHVTLKGFKLVNGATKVNLLQMWKEIAANNGSHPYKNTLLTPAMASGDNTSGSEFYNNLLNFRTITKDGLKYTMVKDTYASVDYYQPAAPKGDIYCLENSSEGSGSTLYGNTTGLIYQFQVSNITDSDNKAGTSCFYEYNGTLYVSLAAIEAADDQVFTRVSGGSITDAGNLLAANTPDNDSNFRTKYGIKVYRDGIMYYTYMIKDQNYYNAENKNYYAVMRNTIYDLTVSSLTNIGMDVPGGWNPETEPDQPLDVKKVYLIVEVKVKPWVLSKEDITLE